MKDSAVYPSLGLASLSFPPERKNVLPRVLEACFAQEESDIINQT